MYMKIYRTFHGKEVTEETIDHQHLSNVIWYWTVVMNYPVESMREDLNLLRRRFNGQLLPYRPHVDFEYEIAFLRNKGMLHKDPGNSCRIVIVGEGKEIGEILYSNPQAVNYILGMPQPIDTKIDYRTEYNPKESKQYHISFGFIRDYYKNEPAARATLKKMFDLAFYGVDMKEYDVIPADKFLISKKQLDELVLHAKDYSFAKETLEKWFPNYKEPVVRLYAVGTLLRRKNHPLNVYTIQKDHLGNYGIYNITHGQWWGNTLPANKMKLIGTYLPGDSKKYVAKDEFAIMCGSHNPDNFYSFDEANSLIKK